MAPASSGAAAARAWIETRGEAAPPELVRRVRSALGEVEVSSATVPGALAEAALGLLRGVVPAGGAEPSGRGGRRGGTEEEDGALRATALDLLAADALLTWACEAAAEAGPETLVALTAEYGAGRLAALSPTGDRPA